MDKDDNIYVADWGKHRIQKFSPEGEFVVAVGGYGSNQLQFRYPVGICYNYRDNNLYVPDQNNHRIQVLTTDLKFVRSFGTQGNQNGQFSSPFDVSFDDANNLFVADRGNHCVLVLTTEGQFLRRFSQKANGEFLNYPRSIAIDSSNIVYVSENGLSKCVSVFTSQGDYITSFGGEGSEEGRFQNIYGLSINKDLLVVSDHGNGRLQIY